MYYAVVLVVFTGAAAWTLHDILRELRTINRRLYAMSVRHNLEHLQAEIAAQRQRAKAVEEKVKALGQEEILRPHLDRENEQLERDEAALEKTIADFEDALRAEGLE
jgi:hypothetical protein